MVIRDTPYLTTDTFLDISITVSEIVSIHSGESQWIYLTRGSNGNAHSIAMNGNVSVTSSGNHTILGFCHDSLNSVKFI